MQTANNHPEFMNDNPIWNFIVEFPLRENTGGEDLRSEHKPETLLQTLEELGLPPEQVTRIEGSIKGIASEVKSQMTRDKPSSPVTIRLYCQRRVINPHPLKPMRHSGAERFVEPLQQLHGSTTKMNGGWGHFLVERTKLSPDDSYKESHCVVELYLYREGE